MKSVSASVAFALLAGVASAVEFTNTEFDVQAGQPFVLTWQDGTGPYQILLKNGISTDLDTVETLVESTTAESATVVLPASLTTDLYAFEIVDNGDDSNNYSVQFTFSGSAASSSATSATTASSTKTTATTSTTSTTGTTSTTSTTGTTTTTSGTASTTMTTSTSSTSTKTSSSSAAATTTVASTNEGRGLAAPLLLAAGIALAAI